MFILDDIREQMRRDVILRFQVSNPNCGFTHPFCDFQYLMYASRWIAFYKLPNFIQ